MSQKITSRERIRLAINHKEADRVPIDFGAKLATEHLIELGHKKIFFW